MPDEPIFIDLADLAGVDAETYQAADRGDRQAQKVMLRKLLTKDASAAALTTGHWTSWMLRMIATGATQATSDALGSIAEAARKGQISPSEHAALDELFEQYFGPGAVGEPTARKVIHAFAGAEPETTALQLFLLADRLASGAASVPANEVWNAADGAEALNAPGVHAFFRAVWAQLTYQTDVRRAFDVGLEAVKELDEVAKRDAVYVPKVGQLAYMVSQLAETAGDQNAGVLLRVLYADQIEKFTASEQ
jgi:hypothetical protein